MHKQGLKFTRFPYMLTLQLKRFDFDYSSMHRIKLNDRMTFPNILNLNKFVQSSDMVGYDIMWFYTRLKLSAWKV